LLNPCDWLRSSSRVVNPLPLRDFVSAWVKVMELDRFDLKR
jgi:catalase (peroxidase I)